MSRLLFAVFTALTLAACYDTPRPACAFYCGQDDACPEDYRCASDGWCKRTDTADDFSCGPAAPGLDPDAAPGPDAALPDAMTSSDAMPIDAALLDAALPDAAPDANAAALR